MRQTIRLQGTLVPVTFKRHARTRVMKLAIYPRGSVTVVTPRFVSSRVVFAFLQSKADWILSTVARLKDVSPAVLPGSKREYLRLQTTAQVIVTKHLERICLIEPFIYKKVSIRNQKTRWGSCSKQGNLSFNYKIALLAPKLQEYVVAHELCHTREFNHSPAFWLHVAKLIPDYKVRRRALKSGVLTR